MLIFTDNVIHCHTFALSEHWLDSIVFYLISDFYYTYLKTLINNKTIILGALSPKFERALKSMTCVQIESIHIDGFKNVKKNSKWYPVAMVSNKNPRKGEKNVFTPVKISQVREIVQN